MLEDMTEVAHELAAEDIKILEANLKITLPSNYKNFLLKYNGGKPNPDCFPIEGLKNNPYGGVRLFFGIDRDIQSNNIDWNYDVMRGRLPTGLLPIASNGSGDILCLALSDVDEGKLYFWDYYGEQNPPTFDNLYFIANSFGEFLDSLFEYPGDA